MTAGFALQSTVRLNEQSGWRRLSLNETKQTKNEHITKYTPIVSSVPVNIVSLCVRVERWGYCFYCFYSVKHASLFV